MARNRYYEDEKFEGTKGRLLTRLLAYVRPYKSKLAFGVIIMLALTALTTVQPYISGMFIDHIFPKFSFTTHAPYAPGLGLPDYYVSIYTRVAIALAIVFGAIYVFIALFTSWRTVILNHVGQYTIYDLRKRVFAHLQKLSFSYYDGRPAGKILVRVTSYIDALADLLSTSIVSLISESMIIIVILVVMFAINPQLSLVSLGAVVPLVAVSYLFKRIMRKKWQNFRNANSNITAYTHENIMGLFITQAFNREKANHVEYRRLNKHMTGIWMNLVLTMTLMGPTVEIINTTCMIAIYLIGYKLIVANHISPGELFSFILYIPMFWAPINNIINIINNIITAMSNIEKVFETLDSEPDIDENLDCPELATIEGDILFDNVTFDYGDGHTVLENVNLHIKKGSTIALVGPTGAGKTTVVNLIPRFYDPTGGRVLIDGTDIRTVNLHSLRKQIGVMMQDSFIFSGTVMDNIRYGREDATDEECINAAKAVFAHGFISKMRDGYNTVLGERGSDLSAGEKQLISFARTILINPRILILDEATANIDTDTERLIQQALAKLLEGRTSFVIAHRLSTIRKADNILYIANRGVAESGTHDELIAAKGKYYELCNNLNQSL